MKFPAIMALAAAGVGAAGLAYARFIEPGRFDITHHDLTLPGLPIINFQSCEACCRNIELYLCYRVERIRIVLVKLKP